MKKQFFRRIRQVMSGMIDIKKWFDYDRIKTYTLYLGHGIKRLFVPQKRQTETSFDEAMKVAHVSESDLQRQQKALYRLSVLMLIFASGFFVYAIYHLVSGSFRASGVSLIVMCIALTLGFRYHFWYFQMKNRKLGCTFWEWYRQGLRGKSL